jgi:DHA1 family tetracycline resistance protein-like MFS transporter
MRLPVVFIMITVTLDAMGIGLILPVMPDLIAEVRGVTIADAALWGGILSAAYAIMQFGFSPTDRVAVGPLRAAAHPAGVHGGLAADYVVMSVAGTIWLLLAGGSSQAWRRRRMRPRSPSWPTSRTRANGRRISA